MCPYLGWCPGWTVCVLQVMYVVLLLIRLLIPTAGSLKYWYLVPHGGWHARLL